MRWCKPDNTPRTCDWSMYTGTLGVALAALSVGDVCADTAITEAARVLASSVIANPPGDDALLDYLVGVAGGIVGAASPSGYDRRAGIPG